jgi:hypothetical protein
MIWPPPSLRRCMLAAIVATPAMPGPDSLSALSAGIKWGEPDGALVAQFGGRATVLPWPLDFCDSYAEIVLRRVLVGGIPVIVFFQMDKRTGGLKRIQIERQRHGANPPALRAILGAIAANFGTPDAACNIGAAPANGYQHSAEWLWRRTSGTIRAIFRDTTIEAFEGCLGGDVTSGYCGLTGRLLVRVSPPSGEAEDCPPIP